ncbi:type II secretion system protein J [Aquipseudomonas alcaligenes]|uniref:PulJ/GspJ family protein n=1 Tax=Aquipseudomonas alcaligenes TaxID=43263 RepID=UPI0037485FE1
MKRLRGFTLVELVMVIALSGLVALMISTVLSRPMEGFVGQSRRAILVDQAAGALNRMSRDVRLAIPNSLRVEAGGQAVEMLLIHSAGRYRPNRVGGEGLSFSSATAGTCGSSAAGGRCDSVQMLDAGINPAGANWMVLYNVGAESGGSPVAGSNVWRYANPGVVTPPGTTFSVVNNTPAGESQIILGNLPAGGFQFAFASPQRRLYLAQTVVGYRCSGGLLLRYSYSALLNAIPNNPPAGSNPQPVAANVASCSFVYQSGSTQRGGLLALNLQLSRDGESVQLMQQVHVDNAP